MQSQDLVILYIYIYAIEITCFLSMRFMSCIIGGKWLKVSDLSWLRLLNDCCIAPVNPAAVLSVLEHWV